MPFIRIFPLREIEHVSAEDFGNANPARCHVPDRFGAKEYFLAVGEIAAFEDCPLYLISEVETDALVNGIRIKLRSGEMLIVPDDPEDEASSFLGLLKRAAGGEVVEMGYSCYLKSLR